MAPNIGQTRTFCPRNHVLSREGKNQSNHGDGERCRDRLSGDVTEKRNRWRNDDRREIGAQTLSNDSLCLAGLFVFAFYLGKWLV